MGIHPYSVVLDPDLEITGGGGLGQGKGWSPKKNLLALPASVWSKNKAGGRPLSWIRYCSGTTNHIARGVCG